MALQWKKEHGNYTVNITLTEVNSGKEKDVKCKVRCRNSLVNRSNGEQASYELMRNSKKKKEKKNSEGKVSLIQTAVPYCSKPAQGI